QILDAVKSEIYVEKVSFVFFSSRRRHTRSKRDWSSDVCSSDLKAPIRTAREVRKLGARAGIAISPMTPVEPLLDVLPEIDMILVMTVEPGFGGQSFLDVTLEKIRRARRAINNAGVDVWIQVDGGIAEPTIERAAEAGADMFVAGSSVFGHDNAAERVDTLRDLAGRHFCHDV